MAWAAQKRCWAGIQGMSQKPIVATKCGRVGKGGYLEISSQSIRAEAEASLRRLEVEVIDVYQIHWPQPDEDIEEGWGAIADLVRAGKVRYAGVCNFSLAQLKRIQPIHPVASLQPPYSMLARGWNPSCWLIVRPQHRRRRLQPHAKGPADGEIHRERVENLDESDHRRRDPDFQEPRLSANLSGRRLRAWPVSEGNRGTAGRRLGAAAPGGDRGHRGRQASISDRGNGGAAEWGLSQEDLAPSKHHSTD